MQGIVGTMVGSLTASAEDVTNIYKVGQNTTPAAARAAATSSSAWLLLRQAEVALAALEAGATGRDQSFYEGKVAAATVLRRARCCRCSRGQRAIAERVDNSLMDLPEDAF